MNITMREQQYQLLQQDFSAGKIDEAAFTTAVDHLGFQDSQGRHWMIGLQTGLWYYFNGQNWQQADPRYVDQLPAAHINREHAQAGSGVWINPDLATPTTPKVEPNNTPRPSSKAAKPSPFMALLAVPIKTMLMVGGALMIVLALLVWPVGSAPPAGGPMPAPSPRPPLGQDSGGSGGGGGGDGGGDSSSSGGLQSAIIGTVTDLSTGQPAAGVEVSVNGQIVRTDTDGSYSITGLAAGGYTVSPELDGQGEAAQSAVYVNVDGQNSVTVDLDLYSQGQPLPTDTPQPAVSAADPPPDLPDSGGVTASRPLVMAGFGILMLLAGGALHLFSRKEVVSK